MSSTILYKLKNAKSGLDAAAAKFEGASLSLLELKRLVIRQSFSGANDMDLEVVNEQTSEGGTILNSTLLASHVLQNTLATRLWCRETPR